MVGNRYERTRPRVPTGPLRSLQLIQSVGTAEPFRIVPIIQSFGTTVHQDDRMAAKVKWAEKAQYEILTRAVPSEFRPFNAVIRISEQGTEDHQRDYLAELVVDDQP